MKMLNCPECGLTITDVQEKCPKCHTKIEDITRVEEQQSEKKVLKKKKLGKRKKGDPKKTEEVSVAQTNEKKANTDEPDKLKEDVITAVVKAEALAVIADETAENKNLCEICMTPLGTDHNFCQSCSSSVVESLDSVASTIAKSDEDSNKFIAAVAYIVFFIPILFGFHRKSKFVKYHTKQATFLFISSTILFLVLVVFRNIMDGLFTSIPMQHSDEIFTTIDTSWRHGTGILFRYYLIAMIYALHLMPFAFMIIGFIYSIQGKKKPLPLMGRLLEIGKAKK